MNKLHALKSRKGGVQCHVVMEQDRLKVEAALEEWVAHLPPGRTGNVSVQNAGTGFRMFAVNPAIR